MYYTENKYIKRVTIFTVRRYGTTVCAVIVCPSYVRPSVTRQYCTKTDKRSITQMKPYDSLWTLVFWCQDVGEIPTGWPPMGAPNRGG